MLGVRGISKCLASMSVVLSPPAEHSPRVVVLVEAEELCFAMLCTRTGIRSAALHPHAAVLGMLSPEPSHMGRTGLSTGIFVQGSAYIREVTPLGII